MVTLREAIELSDKKGIAIGHFNFSNLETLHAIFQAAKEFEAPIIAGLSEGERKFVGVSEAAALVHKIREEHNFPIFLNADHSYSFESVKEAVDAGFDSVIFDGAKLPLEENIEMTSKCVQYVKNCGRDVIVEGELGYIGTSSTLLEKIPEGVKIDSESLTKVEDAKKFVLQSGVDLFAPAVGNIHGMLAHEKEPDLDIERIKKIRQAVKIPLVLHGASGNSDDDLRQAIEAGVRIVHINTELRLEWKKDLAKALEEHDKEVAPYKILEPVVEELRDFIKSKLKIFNNK